MAVRKVEDHIMYESEVVLKAIDAVRTRGDSVKDVSSKFGIKLKTMYHYLKEFKGMNSEKIKDALINRKSGLQVFNYKLDKELVSFILQSSLPVTKTSIRKLAYNMAVKYELTVPIKWITEETAGLYWYSNFIKRHPEVKAKVLSFSDIKKANYLIEEQMKRKSKIKRPCKHAKEHYCFDNYTVLKALKEILINKRYVNELALEL